MTVNGWKIVCRIEIKTLYSISISIFTNYQASIEHWYFIQDNYSARDPKGKAPDQSDQTIPMFYCSDIKSRSRVCVYVWSVWNYLFKIYLLSALYNTAQHQMDTESFGILKFDSDISHWPTYRLIHLAWNSRSRKHMKKARV